MLQRLLEYYDRGREALRRGLALDRVLALPEREELSRLREVPEGSFEAESRALGERMAAALAASGAGS
jgi:hypothetical protein